jgi:probable F420-dependent oxidoreductase
VKVRIGMSMGALRPDDDVDAVLDAMESSGVDSLWLSEVVHQALPDPAVGMAYVAGRTRRLKVGTGVMILPGRHPVLVAKKLASLARLAPKRILPVFGLHAARPEERAHFPVPGPRAAVFDEALELVRRLLTEPAVTFSGQYFSVSEVSVGFRPDPPLDIWLGGRAPAAMARIGRLGDGWLASFLTPAEAATGIEQITAAASDAGRVVDPEHYGVSLPVAFGEIPDAMVAAIRDRRPELDPAELVPVGWDGLRKSVAEFVESGVSKFVVRPLVAPQSWQDFVAEFAAELMPLQTRTDPSFAAHQTSECSATLEARRANRT